MRAGHKIELGSIGKFRTALPTTKLKARFERQHAVSSIGAKACKRKLPIGIGAGKNERIGGFLSLVAVWAVLFELHQNARHGPGFGSIVDHLPRQLQTTLTDRCRIRSGAA